MNTVNSLATNMSLGFKRRKNKTEIEIKALSVLDSNVWEVGEVSSGESGSDEDEMRVKSLGNIIETDESNDNASSGELS